MIKAWKWVVGLLLNNWALKLLSVLLAAISFYAIREATSFEAPYSIPIEVDVDPGVAVLEKSVSSVDVTFQGSRDDVRRLDQTQIRAVVRPGGADPRGSEDVMIRPADIRGAQGVRAVSIRPSHVTLTYDREAEREVAVLKPKTLGKPLVGRVELDYEPRTVKLRGPRRRLTTLNAVSCEPVDVDGRVESFTRKVRVLSPGDAWVYQIDPPEITARVTIVTESTSRLFKGIRVLAVMEPGAAGQVAITPPAVDVTVRGAVEDIEPLVADNVSAYVSCVGLTAGAEFELPVNLYVPADGDVELSAQPQTVRVTLRER